MDFFLNDNYRDALRYLIKLQEVGRGAFKKIALHLNIDPSIISQIMSGKKDFTESQILHLADYFSITSDQSKYLMMLLLEERAEGAKLKKFYFEQRKFLQKTYTSRSQFDNENLVELTDNEFNIFYSDWAYVVVHIYLTLHHNQSIDDICKSLNLDSSRVKGILDFLQKIGFIKLSSGKFTGLEKWTDLRSKSHLISKSHVNWRLKSIEKANHLTSAELMHTNTLIISDSEFQKFRAQLTHLISTFYKETNDTNGKEIAQFNVDLFWIYKNGV